MPSLPTPINVAFRLSKFAFRRVGERRAPPPIHSSQTVELARQQPTINAKRNACSDQSAAQKTPREPAKLQRCNDGLISSRDHIERLGGDHYRYIGAGPAVSLFANHQSSSAISPPPFEGLCSSSPAQWHRVSATIESRSCCAAYLTQSAQPSNPVIGLPRFASNRVLLTASHIAPSSVRALRKNNRHPNQDLQAPPHGFAHPDPAAMQMPTRFSPNPLIPVGNQRPF